jgi:hypothetical protein
MPTRVSTYYTDELTDWSRLINDHNEELVEFDERLEEVIRRNSIVDIAQKVASQKTRLILISGKFYNLQLEIHQQEAALMSDSIPVDDTFIPLETEKKQHELRHKMQATEKEYVDVKFDCYNFLSGILNK